MPEEIDTSTSQLPVETGSELAIQADALPDRRYAAEKVTDALPAAAYERIGQNALSLTKEQTKELELDTPDDEFDIRPDNGAVYASHEYYRRKLNKVFGYMGWTLVPGSPLTARPQTNEFYQRWILFVTGVYVSEALSARQYWEDNRNMDLSDVAESIKSDALRRCCKDLGIAQEAWNKRWVARWIKEYAIQVVAPVFKKGQSTNTKLWRRRDAAPFPGELSERSRPEEPKPEPRLEVKKDESRAVAEEKMQRREPPREQRTPHDRDSASASQQAGASPVRPTPSGMKITDGMIRLLWLKARNAKLVVEKDATLWIDWLHNHDGIDIPEVEGKTTEEVAAAMMKQVQGPKFTKLLKDLDAMKAE